MKNFFVCQIAITLLLTACSGSSSEEIGTHIAFKTDIEGRWGLIDYNGNILIEDEFSETPSEVNEKRFYVKNSDGLYEYYTAEKKFKKIGKEYVRVGNFYDGLAPAVEKDKPVNYINLDGTVAFVLASYKNENIESASEFKEGMAIFKTESGKYGYINTKGNVVVNPVYDYATTFTNNMAQVYKAQNESYGESFIIDKKGKILFKISPDYQNISICKNGRIIYSEMIDDQISYGVLDRQGNKILKASKKHKLLVPTLKNFFIVKTPDEKYGIIDIEGNTIIRAKYESLIPSQDFLIYQDKGKQGMLSYDGNKICDAIYEEIIPFKENEKYTFALDNGDWILIDKKGKDTQKCSLKVLFKDDAELFAENLIESDHVDLKTEVNKVMKYVKKDGGIDKLNYETSPSDFAHIYNKNYRAADLIDETSMSEALPKERFMFLTVGASFNGPVIEPSYEDVLKEDYGGRSYWDREVSGYSYSGAKIKTFTLKINPLGKLADRSKEIFEEICDWMSTNGYTKLSTNNNNDQSTSVYWENNTLNVGTHLSNYGSITIALGKKGE